MKALHQHEFPVPEPLAQNRHTIVMSLVDAFPLRQIAEVPDPAGLYAELIDMIIRLAGFGLIHGDFNEFNVLIKEEPIADPKGKAGPYEETEGQLVRLIPILIDFPQMVSVDHANAEMYFNRDVNCIKRFFKRKFGFESDQPGPYFADAKKQIGKKKSSSRLDVQVEASGFSRKMAKELETYMKEVGGGYDATSEGNEDEEHTEGEETEEDGSDKEASDYEPEGSRHSIFEETDIQKLRIAEDPPGSTAAG